MRVTPTCADQRARWSAHGAVRQAGKCRSTAAPRRSCRTASIRELRTMTASSVMLRRAWTLWKMSRHGRSPTFLPNCV